MSALRLAQPQRMSSVLAAYRSTATLPDQGYRVPVVIRLRTHRFPSLREKRGNRCLATLKLSTWAKVVPALVAQSTRADINPYTVRRLRAQSQKREIFSESLGEREADHR